MTVAKVSSMNLSKVQPGIYMVRVDGTTRQIMIK